MADDVPHKTNPAGARPVAIPDAVYRTRVRAIGALAAGVGLAVLGVGGIVFDREDPVSALVGAAVLAPFVFVLVFRTARAGVFTNDTGIRVLNTWKTIEIPWNQIARFSVGQMPGWAARIGIAELRDGRRIRLGGITGPDPDRPGSAKSAPDIEVEKLNAVLAQYEERFSEPSPGADTNSGSSYSACRTRTSG